MYIYIYIYIYIQLWPCVLYQPTRQRAWSFAGGLVPDGRGPAAIFCEFSMGSGASWRAACGAGGAAEGPAPPRCASAPSPSVTGRSA